MFCSECGTKNNEGATFCQECGAKLGQQVSTENVENLTNGENVTTVMNTENVTNSSNVEVLNTTPKSKVDFVGFIKKNKIAVIIGGVVICLIAAYFIINSTVYSAENFVLKYAQAVISEDVKAQIEFADVYGESDFVTEKVINNKYKDQKLKKIEQIRVLSDNEVKKLGSSILKNDTIKDAVESILGTTDTSSVSGLASSLAKTYVVEYILEGGTSSKYMTVMITEHGDKNLLVFNKWKALGNDVISRNVVVTATKDATVTIDGVKVSNKYLDKEESSSDEAVYNVGTVLKEDVVIGVTLKNGLSFTRTVDTYDKKDIDLTSYYSLDLSSKSKKEVASVVKKFTEVYVGGAVKNEAFENVKSNDSISDKLSGDSSFESDYNSLVARYDTVAIESFNIKTVDVTSATLSSSGVVTVRTKIEYDYKYADSSTKTNKTGDDSVTVTLKFDTEDEKLQVYDLYASGYRYMF